VCFRYPGCTEYALRDINLEIKAGQVIALVGPNGSGKTTIAKLVPRLYDPTSGRITVDGIDLRHLEPADWQRRVSVVFQDFLQYPLSALDNIWLGDISRKPELAGIREAARASGVDKVVEKLPRGYDTILGNEYTGGHELSGGEWQKIAVARAFFREAALAILDEPTSALDPRAEAELFRKFRTLIEGKSAVLISHRFSTVQMADYIYVLDEGAIIEQGTHQELLRLDGTYAQLYHVQAERFLQTREPGTGTVGP
jgi:ATP-binding cassette subfamily B protein